MGRGKLKIPGESLAISLIKFLIFIVSPPGRRFISKKIREKIKTKSGAGRPRYNYNEWLQLREKVQIERQSNVLMHPLPFSVAIIYQCQDAEQLPSFIASVEAQTLQQIELHVLVDAQNVQFANSLKSATEFKIDIHGFDDATQMNEVCWQIVNETSATHILWVRDSCVLSVICISSLLCNEQARLADIVYFDDDCVAETGGVLPNFKAGWSPHRLLSGHYMGDNICFSKHFLLQQKERLSFSNECWLFQLLTTVAFTDVKVVHIPDVLLHLTKAASTAKSCQKQGEMVQELWCRNGITANLLSSSIPGIVTYSLQPVFTDLVSIIIPSKDQHELLEALINSIVTKTTYTNYEIIIVNNNSTTPQFFALVNRLTATYPFVKCIDVPGKFNFSKLMNAGATVSTGSRLLLLNNDMQVIDPDWLHTMLAYTYLPLTGAVGAQLLFPDDTIQHVGVVLGGQELTKHIYSGRPSGQESIVLQTVANYEAVTGAALMVCQDLYWEIGGFDEALPVEYNDIDFCLRLRKKGYFNVCVPGTRCYHFESLTRGHPFRNYAAWKQHDADNREFVQRWGKELVNDRFFNENALLSFKNES